MSTPEQVESTLIGDYYVAYARRLTPENFDELEILDQVSAIIGLQQNGDYVVFFSQAASHQKLYQTVKKEQLAGKVDPNIQFGSDEDAAVFVNLRYHEAMQGSRLTKVFLRRGSFTGYNLFNFSITDTQGIIDKVFQQIDPDLLQYSSGIIQIEGGAHDNSTDSFVYDRIERRTRRLTTN